MQTLKHWRLERNAADQDSLAWLYFDKSYADQSESTNTFSSNALRELSAVCAELTTNAPSGLVILSAKENGFAAGADIDEFTSFKSVDEAYAMTLLGNEVFDQIAALPFPTLALIHGFCMGGGTELALACRYRIMDDGPKAKMALPEVMIGIVPGWGGAKRMPALIGAAQALDLMLTGRGVDARRAKRMGLVDVVTPCRHFISAAKQFLLKPPAPHQPAFKDAITNWPIIRGLVANASRKQVAKRARQDHYPAPYAIIDLWEKFGGDPRNVPRENPASQYSLYVHIQITESPEGARRRRFRGEARSCHRCRGDGRRYRCLVCHAWPESDVTGSRSRPYRPRHQACGRDVPETFKAPTLGASGNGSPHPGY